MVDVLRQLDVTLVISLFFVTLFYFLSFDFKKSKEANRTQLSVLGITAVVIPTELLMLAIFPWLQEGFGNKELDRFLWFNVYALLDIFVILASFHVHRKLGVPYSTLGKRVWLGYTGLAFLQIITYLDINYFQTGVMRHVYRFGIPSINLFVMSSIAYYLIKYFVENVTSNFADLKGK